jgi:hypothetical protein
MPASSGNAQRVLPKPKSAAAGLLVSYMPLAHEALLTSCSQVVGATDIRQSLTVCTGPASKYLALKASESASPQVFL